MPEELTQVEATYRAVARCQSRVICFHPTLPELPALFGMPNQGFNTRAAICKAGANRRLPLRQPPNIQTGLLILGICLSRDSWNTTAVTQQCTACPSLAAAALEA